MALRTDLARWIAVAAIVLAAFAAATLTQRTGTAARVFGEPWLMDQPRPEVMTVETARGLHDALLGSGRRGRIVIYLSRFLHFVPIEGAVPDRLNSFPVPSIDLVDAYSGSVDARNFLWVVLQNGIAREVVHLLPEPEYRRRRQEITEPTPGIDLRPTAIVAHELGSRRIVSSELPRLNETVIVGIDAAYLDTEDVPSTLDRLRSSGVRTDLVVLNLAVDNPDVSDLGRQRLIELSVALMGDGS